VCPCVQIHVRESEGHIQKREQPRSMQGQPSNYQVSFLSCYLIDLFMYDSDLGRSIVVSLFMS
jgi:hypothetical protein